MLLSKNKQFIKRHAWYGVIFIQRDVQMIERLLEEWSPVNWQWISLGGEFRKTFTLFLILSCVVPTF